MADRKFCDRCSEPIAGSFSQILFYPYLQSGPKLDNFNGDLCQPCSIYVYKALGLTVPEPPKREPTNNPKRPFWWPR